jgi:hypothetical protein
MHQRAARRWQYDVGRSVRPECHAIRMKAMAPPNGQFVFCVNSL